MSSPAKSLPNIEIIYTSAACDACDKYHVCLEGEENLEINQPVLASVTIVAYISCFSFGGLSTHTFTIT